MIKIGEIKHYAGLDSEKPNKLSYGDEFFAIDTKVKYKYDQDGLPTKVSISESEKVFLDSFSYDPNSLSKDDVLLVDENGKFTNVSLESVIGTATSLTHGYYGLLSNFYFGGPATETVISVEDTDQWVDVELSVNENGLFDKRPKSMVDAQAIGHDGDGSNGNPIVFKLEGLDTNAFCNFRASMSFDPDEDEGQLESRLLFNRHINSLPSNDFPIEEVSLSMQNGADKDYVSEPMLSFFIGDTIDTNAPGDAGKCRFQIKSNVAGTLKLRALTWYINK